MHKNVRNRRASRSAFTLVEVMVALAVLSIGVTGVMALQSAIIMSNRRAQEITLGTNIARLWMERLRTSAISWNQPNGRVNLSDLGGSQWLCRATLMGAGCANGASASPGAWFIPERPAVTSGGANSANASAFDGYGRETNVTDTAARYCTQIRLSWLRQDVGARQGVLRGEVRVWWMREGSGFPAGLANCAFTNPAALDQVASGVAGNVQTEVHTVYVTTTIVGNPL